VRCAVGQPVRAAFVLVEHYPDRQPGGVETRWHDPFFEETFDLVSFDRWYRDRRACAAQASSTHVARMTGATSTDRALRN
jgi:hypothetical protein